MKVGDVMNGAVVTGRTSESLESLSRKMERSNVGSIPIVEGGRLLGIVTDRDIVVRCISCHKDPAKMTAGEIMSTGVSCITPERSVTEAVTLMGTSQVHRLPVIHNNKVMGMVSLGDIAKVKTDSEVARALFNISQPPCPGDASASQTVGLPD